MGIVRPFRWAKGKPRLHNPPGTMNKGEARYAQRLALEKLAGRIHDYKFEAVKFRLADKTFYTPDFMVVLPDGILEFHEYKGGFMEDDSRVKVKVCASLYPYFKFVVALEAGRGNWKMEVLNGEAEG